MTQQPTTVSLLRARDLEPFQSTSLEREESTAPEPLRLGAPHHRTRWQRLIGAPESYSNLREVRALGGNGPKRIVICADGTWNSPSEVKPGEDAPTNVWLLYQLIRDQGADGMPQLKFYHAGVGASGGRVRRVIDGMTGRGLSRNMLECYRFLVDHYNPGDHLYLFGFSRGAYTVRTLAGLIRNSGILRRVDYPSEEAKQEWIERAYRLYRDRDDDSSPKASRAVDFRHRRSHPDFAISCIGVWDTVGSLGIPVETGITSPIWWFNRARAGFHDVTLSTYVDCAFQALAVDERRGPFRPTLWVQNPHGKLGGQVVEQVWFSGVHSDIGGGYPWAERGLANVTLRWMINRVTDHCRLAVDPRPLEELEAISEPSIALHDSMSLKYRLMNRLRLTSSFERFIDRGLSALGRRDPDQVITETLHPSVERCEAEYAQSFPVTGLPYAPANVRNFRERTGAMLPTTFDRFGDLKVHPLRRRAQDQLPPLIAEPISRPEPSLAPMRTPS